MNQQKQKGIQKQMQQNMQNMQDAQNTKQKDSIFQEGSTLQKGSILQKDNTFPKDSIFQEEQAHLRSTYRQLQESELALEQELSEISARAAEEKKTVGEDLRYNFNNDEDAQETLIEYETMSNAVAQLNISSESVSSRLSGVRRLLPKPYFARINVQFDGEEEEESYYIGTTAFSDADRNPVILDWRTPLAEVYYNHENGATSYETDGRRIPVTLNLRRQFSLEQDRLESYFDTRIALEDPLLIHSLSRKHTNKMQAITETIQKEQNVVIRYPDVQALLVNGIAGSGKTSILLQRIAYLFYRKRQTLRPNQVCLITLNPVFQQYIDHVLPEMGEVNPTTMTWSDFLESMGIRNTGETDMTSPESLYAIDRGLRTLRLEKRFFRTLRVNRRYMLSAGRIASIAASLGNSSVSPWLIHAIGEELQEQARKKKLKFEKYTDTAENSEIEAESFVSENSREQEERLSDTEKEALRENQLGSISEQLRRYDWLNTEAIGEELLGRKELSPAELLYLKLTLTGFNDCNTRYVIIDEVQDYTEVQLQILCSYFKNAHFMLLGDEFQSIHHDTVSFRRIHEMFEEAGKALEELSLMTSYRSSPEITEIFTGMLPREIRIQTSSVQRTGVRPIVRSFTDTEEYEKVLKKTIRDNAANQGLTAIICKDWTGINRIRQIMGEETPHTIRSYEALPDKGVVLMELKLAKGLEFDTVIIPDATAKEYPRERLFRNRLYTAVSRATEKLIILADGNISPYLQQYTEEK